MTLLKADELYRFYHRGDEEVKALRGVSLTLEAGEMIALIGPSGSGKSTLLHCLAGLDDPDGGMVSVAGQPMTRQPEAARRKLRSRLMGIMRQKDNLFSHLSVAENAKLARQLAGVPGDGSSDDVFRRIGLQDRTASFPPQLSGGERARAGLAVAMASNPKLLLLDEPTGEVDAETEKAILGLLAEYRARGGAVVVATHNPAMARLASVALNMKDGRIVDV